MVIPLPCDLICPFDEVGGQAGRAVILGQQVAQERGQRVVKCINEWRHLVHILIIFRARLDKTLPRSPAQQQTDAGEIDPCRAGCGVLLVVLAQPAVASQPGAGARNGLGCVVNG